MYCIKHSNQNQLFFRIVNEWKVKVDGLSMDLNVSQNETRNSSSELFKIKSAYDESVLQLDEVRRENKNLSSEIKDIMDQISEGGRNIHEIDKIRYTHTHIRAREIMDFNLVYPIMKYKYILT